jgi:hypothetical protein
MIKSAVVSPVGMICKFCIQIQNLLEKWGQRQVELSKMERVVFSSFGPGIHPGFGHTGIQIENFGFPSSDSESP